MNSELRRFLRGVAINGALWSIGSGLASATVVGYLAMDYGAAGFALALAIAAPKLTSLVQFVSPLLAERIVGRKELCVGALLASSLTLAILPLAVEAAAPGGASFALAALIVGWALYHLLEYVGVAALWSWMRDEVPTRIRGRAWGVRERWMAAGRWGGLALGAGIAQFADLLRVGWFVGPLGATVRHVADDEQFFGRHLLIALGGTLLVASVVPLLSLRDRRGESAPPSRKGYAAALRSPAFLKLVAFACVLAFANGLLQAPQGLFPYRILGVSLGTLLLLRSTLFAGQAVVAGWFGRRCDEGSHRRWMIACQLVATAGGATFLLATPENPWPFYAAWVFWIAYAGLNVAIPDLTLRFAPRGEAGSWIGLSFSFATISFGVATLLGGWAFDHLPLAAWLGMSESPRGQYDAFFVVGTTLRLLAAAFLFWLPASVARAAEAEALREDSAREREAGAERLAAPAGSR